MSSNLLSKFLPPQAGAASIYDQIREEEQAVGPQSRLEQSQVHDLDERNLNEEYHDDDLDQLLREAADSRITTDSPPLLGGMESSRATTAHRSRPLNKPRWMQNLPPPPSAVDDDDMEPGNLLLEDREHGQIDSLHEQRNRPGLPHPVPGPKSRQARVQWDRTDDAGEQDQQPPLRTQRSGFSAFANRREKAMYRWASVSNLDKFLEEVYAYYTGNGVWSIILQRVIHLLTLGFVVTLSVFLGACVDYRSVPRSTHLSDVVIPKCTQNMSAISNILIWLFSAYWIYKFVQLPLDIPRLFRLHDFYLYLLGIEDAEMQTIAWPQVVDRLQNLKEGNPNTALNTNARHLEWMGRQIDRPAKQRMDAHDIANRLMRKENYLIALFNKDILDFSLPIAGLRNRQLFSHSIEWSVHLCLTDYVFNEEGQVKQLFLKDTSRRELIEGLQRRFMFVGFLHAVFAPLTICYFLVVFFLRHFTEFKQKPSEIGSRSYTPLAEWKFREFNELRHFFQDRMNLSATFAKHYIDQFPKDKTIQSARFVAFVAGALAAVLAAVSLLDPNSFLEFEITNGRTALFYLGIFGAIWSSARGLVPEDHHVFNPIDAMSQVIYHTHYEPEHWKGRLHTEDVRRDFSSLYQMKIAIFFEEILSIIAMPFIFWFSLPPCSERLIDFFREFTIHVDGLGYVCTFAVFDFKQGASKGSKPPENDQIDLKDARSDYYSTKNGKMRDSMMSFRQAYLDPQFAHLRPYAHRAFRTPPNFPGLASSGLMASTANARDQGILRSPTGRMKMSHASPAPSMMLDRDNPHASVRKSRLLNQSRYRPERQPLAEDIEEEEDAEPSASVMFEDGSHEQMPDHEVNEEDQVDHKGGVLGLLTKFTEVSRQGVDL